MDQILDENFVDLLKSVICYSLNLDHDHIVLSYPRLLDCDGQPLILQPSLFPMVCPTIHFVLAEESVSSVPNQLRPYLKWKLSSITANTMKAIVIKSGFRLIKDKPTKTYKNWSAIWRKHMKCNEFKAIKDYQKVNHFPGSFHFGRKDKLWQNLKAMALKHGIQEFGHFHPQTFILPQDFNLLKKYWNNTGQELVFILKPPASARGQGISIIKDLDQIPKTCRTKANNNTKSSLIVQQYITNPCLLYNETKFDLRVYVLITSVVPLRVYLYDDGLVRFASDKYSTDDNQFTNQFVHLTNYSVNKNNLNYVPNNDADGQNGNKWTLKTLWRHLSLCHSQSDVDRIRDSIEDMVIKTIISCEDHISKLIDDNVKSRYSCFELLGFDIMLDSVYKPWLIEVNISPSLRSDSPLDNSVKSLLIKDMLNIIGYQIPPKFTQSQPFGKLLALNRHYYSHSPNDEEKFKHEKYETSFSNNDFAQIHDIIASLTDYDLRQLIEAEDELSRAQSFKRLFPSQTSRQYMKYFTHNSYSNLLLDEWEQTFCNNREKGIERLRTLLVRKQKMFFNQTNSIFDDILQYCNTETSNER